MHKKDKNKPVNRNTFKYHMVFQLSPDSILIHDSNREILDANDSTVKEFGYSIEELKNKSITDFQVNDKHSDKFSFEASKQEIKFLKKNGQSFWAEVSIIKDETYDGDVFIVYIKNIDNLKKSKLTLEASETKFRALSSFAPVGIYTTDSNGQCLYVNPRWTEMTGIILEDALGNGWAKSLHPDDMEGIFQGWNEMVRSGNVWDSVYRFIKANGEVTWVRGIAKPQLDVNGHVIGYIGVNLDITQSKKYENELILAKEKAQEGDRLKSAFLANMSHEIRTPMNGILGFLELLKEPLLSIDEQKQYIEIIERSGDRLLNIINDIISISKIETGQMEIDLVKSNVINQTEYIYNFFILEAESKGLEFSIKNSILSSEADIITDKEKLFAILTNLVKNAIKYTSEGSVELGCSRKGDFLKFYVKDTGLGIQKDKISDVFKRFVQADIDNRYAYEGAGLGLSITKAYIELMGGKISVESKYKQGSTFSFTIPYKIEEKIEETKSFKKLNSKDFTKRLKVLIVEDDESSALLLKTVLQDLKYDILTANNGLDAIKLSKLNTDLDLILMDIKMPGMNGYEACEKIREFNKSVYIIAQTAFGLSGDEKKSIDAGCNGYLSKPIVKNELYLLLKEISIKENV